MQPTKDEAALRESLYLLGAEYCSTNRFSKARKVFLHMLEQKPHTGALMLLGFMALEEQDYEKAINYAAQAVSRCPYSERSSLILHHALVQTHQKELAWQEVERFFNTPRIRLTPDLYICYLEEMADNLGIGQEEREDKKHLVQVIIYEMRERGLMK